MEKFRKLSRGDMKNVNGGKGSTCIIKVTASNGQSIAHPQYFPGTNQQAGDAANAECLKALGNGSATRCGYDCAYDGFGN